MATWAPDTRAVATHLRKWVQDRNSNTLEDFTDETAIRRDEVSRMIDSAVAELGDVPEPLWSQAASVVALQVASDAVIDLDQDLSRDLWERYEAKLKRLRVDIAAAGGKGVGSPPASGRFPEPFGMTRAHF